MANKISYKKPQEVCAMCKKPDESGALAAVESKAGRIIWLCYNCYKKVKD